MRTRRWGFPALLLAAGLALWLLLAGPSKLLGVDTGQAGTALLVTVAWVSLFAIHRMPRGEIERAASPGEWKAWSGVVFMAVAIAYFLSKLHAFQGASIPHDPEAAAVGRNLVLLLVAWSVLSVVIASRWKGEVEEDERDREIARRGSGWGRGALTVGVIGIAVMLAFSPDAKLQWATHPMIANLLVFALMWGCLFEYAAIGVAYWRDRH
jgi:uncharacterized membrane protein